MCVCTCVGGQTPVECSRQMMNGQLAEAAIRVALATRPRCMSINGRRTTTMTTRSLPVTADRVRTAPETGTSARSSTLSTLLPATSAISEKHHVNRTHRPLLPYPPNATRHLPVCENSCSSLRLFQTAGTRRDVL